MSITFQCEHCGKEVKAPPAAAGKRGKCPYCKQSNYIPAPVSEDDVLELTPVDEAEERQRQEEIHSLMEQEKEVTAQRTADVVVPLEHRDDLVPEDMYHFVVNYCLDLLDSRLDRAESHLDKLKQLRGLGRQAVDDFLSGKASEPALQRVPEEVLKGFLTRLRDELKSG